MSSKAIFGPTEKQLSTGKQPD